MEETLKQILNKLEKLDVIDKELKELKTDINGLKIDVDGLKAGQERLEGKVTGLESKIDKLAVKEEEHFNQVLNEIGYVFNDLENKIKAVDTKV